MQGVIMLISITIILLFNFETNISYVFLFLRNFKISPLSVYCLLCFILERKTEKKTLLELTSINLVYMRLPDLRRIARVAMAHCSRETMFEVVQRHYIKTYQANFLLCYVKFIPPLTYVKLRLRSVKLLQTKRRKMIKSYLAEGGAIQLSNFGITRPTSLTFRQTNINIWNCLLIGFVKQIYLFNIVASNYRKKIGFPVCTKENFTGLQAYRKRGKSARASPTPYHSLREERSARFTVQPLSALVLAVCPRFLTSVCWVFSFFVSYAFFVLRC